MPTQHFIVFVGASASLSSSLLALGKRIANATVVAPAMGKKSTGINQQSIEKALDALFGKMQSAQNHTEAARLSIWGYGPPAADDLKYLWEKFGRSAWIEFVPIQHIHKDTPTRLYIEGRINAILPSLHQVSRAVYGGRKTSPLPLPLLNFKSNISDQLSGFWYRDLDQDKISKKIDGLVNLYRQHKVDKNRKYKDDRNIIFEPAEDGVCHGQPHPTGSSPQHFVAGRFRFGTSLFKGFHYEVSSAKSNTLQCTVWDSDSNPRALKSENRKYINIFPNDHLLPAK